MNKTWKIIFYKKNNFKEPVRDFINDLPYKEKAKVVQEIENIRFEGICLGFPFVKKITGRNYKGLWELRIRSGLAYIRIFYFLDAGDTFVLLHGFKKKTSRTPKRELDIAKERMIDYESRK
ncbi:MAG: type II toxin-antitoxin system RelE/ParE family toxin [Actinobacteria bacterium]|nr:type II toxin-antitoxin system RelE/ParE family toxin [Actinomycetota bacterium]